MQLRTQLLQYQPYDDQEAADQQLMLRYLDQFNDCLHRSNPFGHFTASGWVVNHRHDKILMVYHTIYDSWSWIGGHADGEGDLLAVACREVQEETGIKHITPVSDSIFSLEVLGVNGHRKRGQYVSPHVHLNITYLLEAEEHESLHKKADENLGIAWFPIGRTVAVSSEPWMRCIYEKLNWKLKALD
ncbi:MAG: NUDIX hydrolase [Oscillospiraceae bacterium]|jgi:8-oxo-dGTP pyrophosphatase MutT (NUDIX family)